MVKNRFPVFEQLLMGMRDMWSPRPAQLNDAVWEGDKTTDEFGNTRPTYLGAKHHFFYFLEECMRDAYIKGHKDGAISAMDAIGGKEFEFDENMDSSCAREKWEKMGEEN